MKYWAYVNNEILGPFEKENLLELPSFSASLLVCPQTPVGEKTEDWKEVSAYPELAALMGGSPAPSAAPAPAPAPAAQPQQSSPEPAIETPSQTFKPLGGGQSVEPVPPASHPTGLADIPVTHLSTKGGDAPAPEAAPAPEPAPSPAPEPAPAPAPEPVPAPEPEPAPAEHPAQVSSGFDPISLSTIVRRTEQMSPSEPQQPPEGLALEPRAAQGDTAPAEPAPQPAAEPPAAQAEAPKPSGAPEIESFPAAAPQGAAPVTDVAGLENLIQRLDALSRSAVTKNDVVAATDPLRMKLDQMGEVISSIKNSPFQREVMDKLAYLENAVGELRATVKGQAPAAAPGAAPSPVPSLEPAAPAETPKEMEPQHTFFGVQPPAEEEPKKEEKPPEPEPQEAPKDELKDAGSKKSNLGMALKKVLRLLATIALLIAIALGAVIGLKNFGIFDATPFIPFPLPFVTPSQPAAGAAEQPGELPGQAGETPEQPGEGGELPDGAVVAPEVDETAMAAEREASLETAKNARDSNKTIVPPEIVPEIIYIARTFKPKNAAQSLENYVYSNAAKAGGNYNKTSWDVRNSAQAGMFEIDGVIPGKSGSLIYSFLVDREQKSVSPLNDPAKEAYSAMDAAARKAAASAAAAKAAAARSARKKAAARKTYTKPAKKTPAKPKAAPEPATDTYDDDEYEYVYVDEDGYEEVYE